MAATPATTHVQAYILVDACSKQLIDRLQRGLRCMANVLSVTDNPVLDPALGLCMMRRSLETKDVQLQVLLQPQSYNLRDWHLAIAKMQPSEAHQQADDKKLAMAMKTLIDHLKAQQKKETHKDLVQHLHIVAHSFSFIPTYAKLLQEAACSGILVNFCCVAPNDPTSTSTDSAATASANTAAGDQASTSIARFFAAVSGHENATCCSFDCSEHSISQMLLEWVTEAFSPPQQMLQLQLPKPVAGKEAFLCSSSQLVARIKSSTQSPRLCPCHMAPVVPASSTTEVMCSVSKQGLPANSCKLDKCAVQLGHHTQLRLSAFSSALPKLQLQQELRAASAAASSFQVLEVVSTIRLEDINQAAIYGRPQLLRGLSRDLIGDAPLPTSASQEADNDDRAVFAAFTESLLQDNKALLATSLYDADTELTGCLKIHYVLRPAGAPGTLLCCKLAAAEQLLAFEELEAPVPNPQLVDAISKELGSWQPAGLTPIGFMPTSLPAGYHDLINQLVRDSQKPPLPAAAATVAPASTGGHAAAVAAVQRDTKRMSLHRDGAPGQAGTDQNQKPQGAAGRGTAAGAQQQAAAAAVVKGKGAGGKQRVSGGGGAAGAAAATRSGRAPLQTLQLTRR